MYDGKNNICYWLRQPLQVLDRETKTKCSVLHSDPKNSKNINVCCFSATPARGIVAPMADGGAPTNDGGTTTHARRSWAGRKQNATPDVAAF